MPRRKRVGTGGYVFHVLNRGVGRQTIFHDDADYAAFERVIVDALDRIPIRLLSYCLMPNHWHLVLWPKRGRDDDLSEFMRWLTVTHTQRWHAHKGTSGTWANDVVLVMGDLNVYGEDRSPGRPSFTTTRTTLRSNES